MWDNFPDFYDPCEMYFKSMEFLLDQAFPYPGLSVPLLSVVTCPPPAFSRLLCTFMTVLFQTELLIST